MTGSETYDKLIKPIEDRMIKSVWRILHEGHDADDAFQEALALIWKRLGSIERHPNPQALILRICVNAAYDVLRRRARRTRLEGPPDELIRAADPSPAPADRLASIEQRQALLKAVEGLPRRQAEVMLMLVVAKEPVAGIAQAVGCSEATVRSHVNRARTRLARVFPEYAHLHSTEVRK